MKLNLSARSNIFMFLFSHALSPHTYSIHEFFFTQDRIRYTKAVHDHGCLKRSNNPISKDIPLNEKSVRVCCRIMCKFKAPVCGKHSISTGKVDSTQFKRTQYREIRPFVNDDAKIQRVRALRHNNKELCKNDYIFHTYSPKNVMKSCRALMLQQSVQIKELPPKKYALLLSKWVLNGVCVCVCVKKC